MLLPGCLSTPPAPATDGAPGPGADARPAGPDPRIGDLLTYTFDDDPILDLVRDRSGSHRHGDQGATTLGTAELGSAYGESRKMNTGAALGIFVLRDPGLVPPEALTVEAWVLPTVREEFTVFGNYVASRTPPVDYSLEVDDDGHLRLVTNTDMTSTAEAVATTGEVPLGTWTHVAASWDHEQVHFYVAGELVDVQPLAAPALAASSSDLFAIGRRRGGTHVLQGGIDEVKVSSYAKTAAEILASLTFDSASLRGTCVDGFAEPGEACLAQGLCCDDACEPVAEDAACEGTCTDGRCSRAGLGRVTDGLAALYTFAESGAADDVVPDLSDNDPPMNLLIADLEAVTRANGILTIDAPTILEASDATRMHGSCTSSGEVTIEAWARPAVLQGGPARLVSFSVNVGAQTFVLGQELETWTLRLRQRGGNNSGKPGLASARGDAEAGRLSHLVVTARAGGERRFYVDGFLRDVGLAPGDFSTWDASHLFRVANEAGLTRPWLGDIHLVAVYCRALDENEMAQNFGAGSDPELE